MEDMPFKLNFKRSNDNIFLLLKWELSQKSKGFGV